MPTRTATEMCAYEDRRRLVGVACRVKAFQRDLGRMVATTSQSCAFASEYGGVHVRLDTTLRDGVELFVPERAAIEPVTEDLFF